MKSLTAIFLFIFLSLSVNNAWSAGNICSVCAATWTDPNPASMYVAGYKLYLATSAGGAAVQTKDLGLLVAPLSAALSTAFTLVSGTQYYVKVTAYNVAGESLPSNEVPFVFLNTAPSAPTGLIVK